MTPQQVNDAKRLPISGDLSCGNCEYNLRTLDWESKCPECGRPVRESRPLPGFRFSGLRASPRLRIVLGLLVVATLVAVLIEIWVTYVFLTWFPTVNKTKFNIEACRRYVSRPCGILLMMVIWVYLRKLRAALRQTRYADGG